MHKHDIIDNRHDKLVDHINHLLPETERAKFAVGYFFLSGLEAVGNNLDHITELRLLIGNTSNRQTIEQIAEGYRRLELATAATDSFTFPNPSQRHAWVQETAGNLRHALELMDQTDGGQHVIQTLVRLIEEQRLHVRVYTKGRLHSKAYIFDYANPNPGNRGIAIVGSSNFTLSGLTHNTELNVIVHDNASPLHPDEGNHAKLTAWFNELWDESEPFAAVLMEELRQSWAAQLATPYDIYMKTLYALVRDRLEGGDEPEVLWDDDITRTLTDFQKDAVRQAVQMIRDNGGCFVADVVGLGKSYIGAGIVKHFERTEQARSLIICPKPLEEMWIGYNERYYLNAHILPMSMLMEGEHGVDLLNDVRYRDRNFILVDESHNFRRHDSQRYRELQQYLSIAGRKVCLLTATPRNNDAWDVYNQIKLFHPDDITDLPVDPPDLRQYFKLVEANERQLQDVLRPLIVRRTRRRILRWYGYAEDTDTPLRELSDADAERYLDGDLRAYILVGGHKRFFPRRQLHTLRYSIEAAYSGLYGELLGYLGRPNASLAELMSDKTLYYARYGLWRYLKPEKQNVNPYTDLKRAGINLRGLIRTMLFKRFESSVYAFRESIKRMIKTHERFLASLDQGFVPAGEKAEQLLGNHTLEDADLMDQLASHSQRYKLQDFRADLLRDHVEADLMLFQIILEVIAPITATRDDKLQTLKRHLRTLGDKKVLIFSQYADTAQYLYDNLNPNDRHADIDVIFGNDKSKSRIVGRFAPRANPEFAVPPDEELRILIATDVLAEGLNMQDGHVVLNYDLHWNPVRLIQRFGRIDRIGSVNESITGINFLPELELERSLGLQAVLANRIQDIHNTIGEDAAILDTSEQLNPDAMYAIYGGDADATREKEDDVLADLSEAEELFRSLMRDDPEEFERIVNLRDGIRSGKPHDDGELFVFCEAGRFQQLFLVDAAGKVISQDMSRVLHAIRAAADDPAPSALPTNYNKQVMAIKKKFARDAKRRLTQQTRQMKLTLAQKYVLRELSLLRMTTDDDDLKGQIDLLVEAFTDTPTQAVQRQINFLRRNGMIERPLLAALTRIYHEHRLRDRSERQRVDEERADIPRIVCSEALL